MVTKLRRLDKIAANLCYSALDSSLIALALVVALWSNGFSYSDYVMAMSFPALMVWLLLSVFFFALCGLPHRTEAVGSLKKFSSILAGSIYSTLFLFPLFSHVGHESFYVLAISYLGSVIALFSIVKLFFLDSQSSQLIKSRVLVVGTGSSAIQLANTLSFNEQIEVVAVVDPYVIHRAELGSGVQVYPLIKLNKLMRRARLDRVFLCLPNRNDQTRKKVLSVLCKFSVPIQMVSGLCNLEGVFQQPPRETLCTIEDILSRDPLEVDQQLISPQLKGRVVLITGAGGSIGSELCRELLAFAPATIVLFELSEFALYEIERELLKEIERTGGSTTIVPVIGSVQNYELLVRVMREFQVSVVYHAAAYKHVPMVEYNIIEGVKNNVFGAKNCAEAAIKCKVERFVLISTDKAVRATNIMGASKRVAELMMQSFARKQSVTTMCVVRFGNVIGSSGSVIPLFARQIEAGGPITLTDHDVSRYFMTTQEAALLVLHAGSMAVSGDVFMLDMGQPVRIYELAKKMIQIYGLRQKSVDEPDGDIEIQITGLRPGEKLHEELSVTNNLSKTRHTRIKKSNEIPPSIAEVNVLLNSLDVACQAFSAELVRKVLEEGPTGFKPSSDICDLMYKRENKTESADLEFMN